MGIPSPAMVKIFKVKEEVLTEKYVIGSFVVCPNSFERVTALLFNALTNKKRPLFKTMEEAIDWVKNEQTTKDKFETI